MTRTIYDITDKDLVELIDRIDNSIKENKLQDECLYMYTPRKVAKSLFPGVNYAEVNTLISRLDIPYYVIGTTALTEVIVAPLPMTNFDIYTFDVLREMI